MQKPSKNVVLTYLPLSITALFLPLKIAAVIEWSWWQVFAPSLIGISSFLLLLFGHILIVLPLARLFRIDQWEEKYCQFGRRERFLGHEHAISIRFQLLKFSPFLFYALAFIILRIVGHINWSWVWILAPIWIPIAFDLSMIAVLLVWDFLEEQFETFWEKTSWGKKHSFLIEFPIGVVFYCIPYIAIVSLIPYIPCPQLFGQLCIS